MTLRILHVLNTPRAEGTPNLVIDWLNAGLDAWQGVFVLNSQPADLSSRLRELADFYEECDLHTAGIKKYWNILRASYRMVQAQRPDLLVCWPTGFSPWIAAGAYAAGCRNILVHAGNPAGLDRRNRLITKYVTWPLSMMRAKVICCSTYVMDTYRKASGIPRSLFHAVYNCTRAAEVSARAKAARALRLSHRPTAIMVATLEAHKDHESLLNAVPLILEKLPDFLLRLAGDGRFKEKILKRIHELDIGAAVEVLGMRKDIPELLGQADLFVFSTTFQEGLGSVLLEALAAGLPVIATDVPACRELLEGGRWGRLIPVKDPAALACAVIAQFESEKKTSDQSPKEFASRFAPSKMITEYLNIAGFRDARMQ